jgi:hypothetical protein
VCHLERIEHSPGSFEELAVCPKINISKAPTRELAWCIQWPVQYTKWEESNLLPKFQMRAGGVKFKAGAFELFLSLLQQNHKALNAKKEDPSTFDLLAPRHGKWIIVIMIKHELLLQSEISAGLCMYSMR